MRIKPLRLWVIRHRTQLTLHGEGDIGEWSGVYTNPQRAIRDMQKDYAQYGDVFEIVELVETNG